MSYRVMHTTSGRWEDWQVIGRWHEGHREAAIRSARQRVMDKGGYVNVADNDGNTVFGTDPVQLDRAIRNGINKGAA